MPLAPRGNIRVFVLGLGWPGALFAQSTTIIQGQVTTPGRPPSGATVSIDGRRLWVPGSTNPPDINDFRARELEAIEVYRGPAEVPMQYQSGGTVCGVVLFWTRQR
ncbi:MAG: hypothetical protein AB7R55_17635 [Gemmatimonadales bacterium]